MRFEFENQAGLDLLAKAMPAEIEKAVKIAGNNQRVNVIQRALSGIGLNGPVRSYSKGYKKYKQDKGRSGKVDYTLTGRMLQSIVMNTLRRGDQIIVEIFSSSEKDKLRNTHKLRPFFGFTSKEEREFQATIDNQIQKILDNIK